MKESADIANISSQKISPIFRCIIITGPLFALRIPDSSFSLTDFFLVIATMYVIIKMFFFQGMKKRNGLDLGILTTGILFAAVAVINTMIGIQMLRYDFKTSDFLSGFIQYLFLFIAMPLVAAQFLHRENLWSFMRTLVVGYLIPLLVLPGSFLPDAAHFLHDILFLYARARSTYENPNSFGAMCAVMMAIFIVVGLCDPKRTWRWVSIAAAGLSIAEMALTVSFGAAIVLAAVMFTAFVLMVFVKGHPLRRRMPRFLGICAVVLAVFVSGIAISIAKTPGVAIQQRFKIIGAMFQHGDVEETKVGSTVSRIQLTQEAIGFITERQGGLWGHGLRQTPYVSKIGNVHNTYLLLWTEGGLFLLLLYLLFFVFLIRNCIALTRFAPYVGVAMAAALAGVATFGGGNPGEYLRYFWIPVLPLFKRWLDEAPFVNGNAKQSAILPDASPSP